MAISKGPCTGALVSGVFVSYVPESGAYYLDGSDSVDTCTGNAFAPCRPWRGKPPHEPMSQPVGPFATNNCCYTEFTHTYH